MDIIQTARPSVAWASDPTTEVAALAIQNGEAEKTIAHQERDVEEAAEAQANAAEVQAMHDEASNVRKQGLFDAATAVAGAVIGVACPPAAGKETLSHFVLTHAADGAQKLGDGFWKGGQNDDEARAAAARASAAAHADAVKDASDASSDASAAIGTALDFSRSATSIESETQLAALHRA